MPANGTTWTGCIASAKPQDFIIHTGEFLADATDPQLRAVIGFLAVQRGPTTSPNEPWTSQEFANASVDRGKTLYKEYCAQCHGFTGKGDGPAASGLEPKPAIHANMPFDSNFRWNTFIT